MWTHSCSLLAPEGHLGSFLFSTFTNRTAQTQAQEYFFHPFIVETEMLMKFWAQQTPRWHTGRCKEAALHGAQGRQRGWPGDGKAVSWRPGMEDEARPVSPLGNEATGDRTNVWVERRRERPPGVGWE